MQQSPPWEAGRFSATQEIPRILCNPKDHYPLNNGPPLDPILSHINPVHPSLFHFLQTHFISIFPPTPGSSFPQVSPPKTLYAALPYPVHTTCPDHLILLTRTIFGEKCTSLSSSSCSVLHSPGTSSLLGPNILPRTLFSDILSLRSSLYVSDHDSHPYKTTGKFIVLYFSIFILLDSKLDDKRFCTEW